jgi:SAM-dependent methyltransferase
MDEQDHIARNRAAWSDWAADYAGPGERAWASPEPYWGIWGIPEEQVHLLPDDLAGKDVVELGCGTGYVSAWLARRGARPVAVDISPEQLTTARRLQQQHHVSFTLLEVSAERLPFPDASFDLAISEYGACLWADPCRWVPEAARVLRPGGRLIFLTNGVVMMLCTPDDADTLPDDRLVRDYFGMHRFEWPDAPEVEFHLGHGEWIRLLRACGFDVEELLELRPPAGATTEFGPIVDLAWARRWPCEEVWKARTRG